MKTEDYRKYKEILVAAYKSDGLSRAILICVTSHIPLLAMYRYLDEEYPARFQKEIDGINEFYGYKV